MSTWRDRVTQSLGDAASRSGVLSETAGKIFAVLYLNPGPLSLDEISREVGTTLQAVGIAWWAGYVAHSIDCDPALVSDPRWSALNVERVLAAMEPMLL